MVRKVPFELFGEGQYLRFDIGKFMIVEQIMKKPIGELLKGSTQLDLTLLTILLHVGVRTDGEFQAKSLEWYADKIQELLLDGHGMEEIQLPVIRAVAATGILGHTAYVNAFPEQKTGKLTKKAEAEGKNA